MAAIGIDLGTTNSCVAVVRDGQVEMLKNKRGIVITPSIVAFHGDRVWIGEAARYKKTQHFLHENMIYSAKRIIGKKFDENFIQKQNWPFTVVKDDEGMSTVQVVRSGKKETFRPEEISALVLHEMKLIACKRLGRDATKQQDAVITVPVKFNISQRLATEAAAKIAGLNVIGIINEPTAAALAYGISQGPKFFFFPVKRHVLVYDLGGGTFDVVVIEIKDFRFEVLGYAGDLHIGGDDFTNNLVSHWEEKGYGFRTMSALPSQAEQLRENRRNLRERAEEAKKELSFEPDVDIPLKERNNDMNSYVSVTQADLNKINMELYLKTIKYMKEALGQAGIAKDKIQDVVFAGGSTRIPFIRELVARRFPKAEMHSNLNPEEVVAQGAAICAAQLSGVPAKNMAKLKYVDIVPYSLGTDEVGDKTRFVIKKNSQLPTEAVITYVNVQDDQDSVQMQICHGEEKKFSQNELIGILDIAIRPAEAGKVKVEVKFKLDNKGMLSVTAKEKRFPSFLEKKKEVEIKRYYTSRDKLLKEQTKRMETIMERLKEQL